MYVSVYRLHFSMSWHSIVLASNDFSWSTEGLSREKHHHVSSCFMSINKLPCAYIQSMPMKHTTCKENQQILYNQVHQINRLQVVDCSLHLITILYPIFMCEGEHVFCESLNPRKIVFLNSRVSLFLKN